MPALIGPAIPAGGRPDQSVVRLCIQWSESHY